MNSSLSNTHQSPLVYERLHSFYELSSRIAEADSLQEFLSFVIDRSLATTGARQGLLLLQNDEERSMHYVALLHEPGQHVLALQQLPQAASSAIIHEVLTHGRTRLITDLPADDQSRQPQNRAAGHSPAARSVLAVPLMLDTQVVGLLYLDHPEPSLFDNDDAAFLNAFLKQAMSGISQGQQRYQQSADATQAREQARYLAYLNEIGSALTRSLDLTHVLQVIIERVNALLETERTSVFLIDEATNELILRYSNEDNADIRLPAPWQGIAGWVATHDEPTLVNDVRNDPRHLRQFALDTGYEAHSILCVPLKVEGHVIGVVEVLNKTGGQPFTLHHQALLTDLTQWAAIALHNARLFDERVRAYQHLAAEQQRRIAAETRNAMAAVVLDMAHTMNNIIGAIRVWAITLEQEPLNGPRGALHKQMVGSIRQNAEEAIELIRTMRGPLEQASVAPLDVNQCLNNAIRSCWHPENVTLHVNYGTRLPLVEANIARLEAVFQNVVSNAIQALTHEGGSIHIRTRRTSDGKAEIVISDNGPGIAPEIQEQLFTPGVSDREGRLGIGLWLVETFIRQFNGYIEWSSLPDTGTTFIITLPPAAGDIES